MRQVTIGCLAEHQNEGDRGSILSHDWTDGAIVCVIISQVRCYYVPKFLMWQHTCRMTKATVHYDEP